MAPVLLQLPSARGIGRSEHRAWVKRSTNGMSSAEIAALVDNKG